MKKAALLALVIQMISFVTIAQTTKSFTVKGVTFTMVKVDYEGDFFYSMNMSSARNMDPDYDMKRHDEKNYGREMSFYIGQTEVTQELWKAVMGKNPSFFHGENLPVEMISWYDCLKFISKLNKLTGEHFRLPTWDEWRIAADSGESEYYSYSGSNDSINDVAWFEGNSNGKTHEVATKLPNKIGIYDMSGNVWEWCDAWCKEIPGPWQNGQIYSLHRNSKGPGIDKDELCICRGGGYDCSSDDMWLSYSWDQRPQAFRKNIGLRLAMDIKE